MTAAQQAQPARPSYAAPGAWRICYVHAAEVGAPSDEAAWDALCRRAREAGFDMLMCAPLWRLSDSARMNAARPGGPRSFVPQDADQCDPALQAGLSMEAALRMLVDVAARHGLDLALDLLVDRVAADGAPGTLEPSWFRTQANDTDRDPRQPAADWETLQLREGPPPAAFLQRWQARLAGWMRCGVKGFRCLDPHRLGGEGWRQLLAPLREDFSDARFFAWTPGLNPWQVQDLRQAGFDAVYSSLPWWNLRAPWLAQEDQRLRAVAPVIAMPEPPFEAADPQRFERAMWTAALTGDGVMVMPRSDAQWDAAGQAVRWRAETPLRGTPRLAVGDRGYCTLLLRDGVRPSTATEGTAHALLLNPDDVQPARADWSGVASLLPTALLQGLRDPDAALLPPGGFRLDSTEGLSQPQAAHTRPATGRPDPRQAPRIAVEQVSPVIDNGSLSPKCVVGETVRVQADIFMDGHDVLAAEVRWRATDETHWHVAPMRHVDNDRWQAELRAYRNGPHEFRIAAWLDEWETYRTELRKKHAAGLRLEVELREGTIKLREALLGSRQNDAAARARVDVALAALAEAARTATDAAAKGGAVRDEPIVALSDETQDTMVAILLDRDLAQAMELVAPRPFLYESPDPYPLWVDRRTAAFSSWYELFPRSQAAEPGRHGTFDDVQRRLPDVRAMGFDVLYFPPIHPIGRAHRKGPNNTLKAGENDPGSPYAIGSPDGGHDAVHPELGSLDDFLRLVQAAREHGMELALDFAIQCSPDHPWLAQRPEWFTRRADGTIRYAENPPKKYEDIVNVSFYRNTAKRARVLPLWRALRDVVLFWVEHGVRIFRVDNPHTKPLPFWEWMISDIHMRHPDVIFLSEAFTRPKMMYRLAKIGFTQSYTYFTWRNDKDEIAAYLEELAGEPVADFFRANFFVNTPDINPYYLQCGARSAFLARAALAALGAGSWGLYSGFELCEWQPVPGKEEYLDSEKYELRQRDWDAPGNIKAEIAQLNAIRHANPALWSQRGYRTVANGNPQVLSFMKATDDGGSTLLAAINLDPYNAQYTSLEVPYDAPVRSGRATLQAEDLLDGGSAVWHDGRVDVALHPGRPYRVWRLTAPD
ncbi:alpha-1,4-glucan--maltose-1-phosphate maltosyltransferase [Bordetella genomosp. 13]|uniref:alpha-1,4-glucan--maltose-1-phosphate maltosyltransferase n=1 Tax=Bordetella genomosp. 13 TaxID=463040 RepID=UPI0011A6726B|nr:alpha-1,4-glucan--maltose-1-phosphate maltosyltransferase [Bordetella genomosp. 13]